MFITTVILDKKNGIIILLSIEEYLNKVRPYLKDMIYNIKKKIDAWKIQKQLTCQLICLLKTQNEERVMHLKSDNIEIMIKASEVKELFESLFSRYQIDLEESMKGSDLSLVIFIYYISNVKK